MIVVVRLLTIFFFCKKLRMFFSRNAIYCENVNNVFCILFRNVKCDREMRFQIFLLAEVFLWIRFRDHVWSSHYLCFDCLTRVFSRWLMFDKKNSSNLDESDLSNMSVISSNLIRDVSSNLRKCISSNLINNISSNLMTISHQILTNDISSNLMISHQILWKFCLSSLISVFEWQARM